MLANNWTGQCETSVQAAGVGIHASDTMDVPAAESTLEFILNGWATANFHI